MPLAVELTATQQAQRRIIAFPRNDITYNVCLYAAVEQLGVEVVEGFWAGRWLNNNVRPGDIVHIHWPSFLYFVPNSRCATTKGLARFALFIEMLRHRGARIVWTAHNLYPHDGGDTVLSHRIARRIIARRAHWILAHGPTAATIVRAEFAVPESKLRVIKHGHWIDHHSRQFSASQARFERHDAIHQQKSHARASEPE